MSCYHYELHAGGRYIESDPIGILRDFSDPSLQMSIDLGIFEPIDFHENINHVYGYVSQNPINFYDPFGLEEHTKNARPSTKNKHQKANARRAQDGGGEKGDANRTHKRKKPSGWMGPWPPRMMPIPMLPNEMLDPCFIYQGEGCVKPPVYEC